MSNHFLAQCIGAANAAIAEGQYAVAVDWCKRAIRSMPRFPEAWYNLGIAYRGLGQQEQSLEALKRTDALSRDNPDAQNSVGLQLLELGAWREAERCFSRAISLAPGFAFAHSNLGMLREKQGRLDDAEASIKKAIELQPDLAPAYVNLCCLLILRNFFESAEAAARRAIDIDPLSAKAWTSLAVAQCGRRKPEEAEAAACAAIKLDPVSSEAWVNLCDVFSMQKRYESAESAARKAIELAPESSIAWRKLGQVLVAVKKHKDAADCFARCLALDPQADAVRGEMVNSRMQICDWSHFSADLEAMNQQFGRGKSVSSVTPFLILALTTDSAIHLKASKLYAAGQSFERFHLGEIPRLPRRDRVRIGYYSADFHNHATAYLMAELFELHDKRQFELVGFSFGPDFQDEMRQRVSAAFDQFIDVRHRSDREIALLSRELGIDIAIDLKGYTQDCRPGIFASRAAPIQVSYLGFPGTMGVGFMDYIIADKTLIPPSSQSCYSEKIVYLPNSYQVNDAQRDISLRVFTRDELGLPSSGFVFACFNNSHKITPPTFAGWMRILSRVDDSVLWLFETNPEVVGNLRKEAASQGVEPCRLVFAKSLPLPDHLARIRIADLFLDTLPYNAHTTTSDALWAGLPVLTCPGESFASRVAASLLNAIDLPELITPTQLDYENTAVDLAKHPDRLRAIRQKLVLNRNVKPLFDSRLFTRHIEAAYLAMYERYQSDLPPDHIDVGGGAST
jgi:predicted O-linked N-acetylglucosamine transferase (SPINDLY family)